MPSPDRLVAGSFGLRPVDPAADAALVHRWVTHPKAVFWQQQEATVADVRAELERIGRATDHAAFLGLHDGAPAFLMERYDPRPVLSAAYPVAAGDVGMHFLVAPTDAPIAGFTRAVLTAVMEFLFSDPAVARVVVEPDVRNRSVHRLNAYVGFEVLDTVSLPDKQALLSVCTRERFVTAREHARTFAATREGATWTPSTPSPR